MVYSMYSGEETEGETKQQPVVGKKVDISKLVSIIPPASQLRRKEAKVREKRIRIRYDESTPQGCVKIPAKLAEILGINEGELVDIVVAGRHKFVYKAIVIEEDSINNVYCHPEELREKGVADNSIATVRKHSGGG